MIIGIDLGTTNSLVAYWTNEGAKLIPNALGSNLTPSIVSLDENDEILVGEVAKQRLITYPDRTVSVFKRYMGTNKSFILGKYTFLPEELSSFVIRSLKKDAESYLGEKIEEAVISVPAYFNDSQRKATKRAGELAGLKVERIINEPTAAAIAYGLHEERDETKFLVFDLGGGTFDVSILELFEDIMEVKSIAGDNYLGGEDFTEAIYHHFLTENNISEGTLDIKTRSKIKKQAEMCKRQIGIANECGAMDVTLEGKEIHWEISPLEFEEITKPLIKRLRLPIERAIRDASINAAELDEIILVGGATRMPIIRNFVGRLFGRLPAGYINPDEVVALGAAVQAGMKNREASIREVILTDVCPYTLGTEVVVNTRTGIEQGHYLPIIERNTIIPVSKVEKLYTARENQDRVNIVIYQGESRHAMSNVKLGEINIQLIPVPNGHQSFDLRYTYDINGILEVEVTIHKTGEKKRLVIEENPGLMSKEEVEERLKALEKIKVHPRDKMENRFIIERGERLYEESLGSLRESVAHALIKFEEALGTQDERIIRDMAKQITEFFNQIENRGEF